ncbi:MAG: LptF/LptG family permease [Pleomorphochaeta sp.]
MKIITKYICSNIIKILFSTVILTSLLLLSVDLFSNFDSYVQNNVEWSEIARITIYYLPQAFLIVFAPASLFSITFFLSQMNTNNEVIALLSSGYPMKMVYKIITILMFCISILLFLFNENVVLQSKIDYNLLKNEAFNINNNFDNSNIGLIDSLNNNVIYANKYKEENKTLYKLIVVKKDDNNKIVKRIDAKNGVWSQEKNYWILNDVKVTNIYDQDIYIEEFTQLEDPTINLEPNMFRNLSLDIQTMYFSSAIKYLKIQRNVNLRLWYESMSDFLERLLEPFSIIIMTVIACSIDYKGRKNVFLFSVFNSIILAVVYYVSKMVFQIASKQGLLNPYIASLLPFLIILIVTLLFNKIKLFTTSRKS